jgi:hypothetical protein
MSIQTSTKRGVQSSSRKAVSSRHGIEPQPRSQPVAGAFGREGADRQTPLSAGPLEQRPRGVAMRRIATRSAVGISNLPPEPEQREQRWLPPRWHRKRRSIQRGLAMSDRLKNMLVREGARFEVIRHREAYTAQERAAACRITGRRVAKVVVVRDDEGSPDRPWFALAVLPAAARLDLPELRALTGRSHLTLAREDEFAGLFPRLRSRGDAALRQHVRPWRLHGSLAGRRAGARLRGWNAQRRDSDADCRLLADRTARRGIRGGRPPPSGVEPIARPASAAIRAVERHRWT